MCLVILSSLFSVLVLTFNRVSATNAARIYNNECDTSNVNRNGQPTQPTLTGEQVWDGFFLHSLLLEHSEHGTVLELAHNAHDQAERLRPALEARNAAMVGPGQEMWSHACELCCKMQQNATGGYGMLNNISLSADK